MTLKKYKIIGLIGIFLLSFLSHFLYEWFPNPIFSIFFPVNESIWEHMKLIFTPFVLYTIIEYLFLRKKIKINNIYLQLFLIPALAIMLYLIIYLPIFYTIGENMAINIGLLFIITAIEQALSLKISEKENYPHELELGLIGMVILLFTFTYFTYFPPKNELFFDTQKEIYGISKK